MRGQKKGGKGEEREKGSHVPNIFYDIHCNFERVQGTVYIMIFESKTFLLKADLNHLN